MCTIVKGDRKRFSKDGFNIGVRNVAPDSWKVKKREFISGGECTYTGTYEEQITLGIEEG